MPVPYIISTYRLGFRELKSGDGGFIVELNNHPDVLKYTGDAPFESVEDAEDFIRDYDSYQRTGMGRWVIELLDTQTPIGWCGVKHLQDENQYDLGYRILPRYWNQGFATEAGEGCLKWAIHAGIKNLLTCVHHENKRSLRVSEKLGFGYAYERYYGATPWLVLEKPI